MIAIRPAAAMILLSVVASFPAAAQNAGGATSGNASQGKTVQAPQRVEDDGMRTLGFDLSQAGTSAEDQKRFFTTQTKEQQAQILARCEKLTTTGSVANADQPKAGTDAMGAQASDLAGARTAISAAKAMAFCDAVQ
jgi:hypothetical protein